ncbi:hypothetical protein bpr_I1843 [Butyrivibrio proteoclasticus B316]|uniref:DUF1963 domain-containing protein n=1 Tax=Butyrivibrio proteoclasticus (strain ATCC 51982 / DSM 14932 / B316) TaxID=515622 RepID=E0RWQ2_BUTPB|nr:YwqG family protein [Butyrivibrio proteoclasticus]ADL34578.1 hypothetical protein bpr_I1843 [Butyrivibrio proteoclasticus B316]
MGIFSILRALTATNARDAEKAKKTEFDLKNDTGNNTDATGAVFVKENMLVIPREKLDILIERIKKDTERKVINIETEEKADIGLTDSKFGGYPYWPSNMEYPVNSEGDKLILLAQINLSDVSDNRLPETGILQFFISCDDINGLDDEKGYKVVYHKDIDPSVTEASVKELGIRAASDLDHENDEYMPLSKSYSLTFSEDTDFIGSSCNTFESVVAGELKSLYNIDMNEVEIDGYYKLYGFLNADDSDYLSEAFSNAGHKMFGYPFFTQEDPRDNGENDILLFQMDSDYKDIMWGDSGVGGFFISEENLKNLDFDKVVYNWDCY